MYKIYMCSGRLMKKYLQLRAQHRTKLPKGFCNLKDQKTVQKKNVKKKNKRHSYFSSL